MDQVASVFPLQGTAVTANPMEDSVTSFAIDDLIGIVCCCDENENSVPSHVAPPPNVQMEQPNSIDHKSLSIAPTYMYNNMDAQQVLMEKPILTLPARGPVLRSKSFDDALLPRRTNDFQQLQHDPPNTIVFISTLQRQRRRSSICSQITLDEEFDRSSHNGYNGVEGEEEDTTNVSMDIRDVFESKKEYKFNRRENQSTSSTGVSSNSTSQSSSCNDSAMKRKRPEENIQRAASFRLLLRKQNNIRTPTVNQLGHQSSKLNNSAKLQSSKLNNSAKLRWLQNEDSDSSEASPSSDYEDFAQDSLKRVTSTVARQQKVGATRPEWKLVAEDSDLKTNRVPCQRHPEALPRRKSTGVGRVA
jgi:hypothetical protein